MPLIFDFRENDLVQNRQRRNISNLPLIGCGMLPVSLPDNLEGTLGFCNARNLEGY